MNEAEHLQLLKTLKVARTAARANFIAARSSYAAVLAAYNAAKAANDDALADYNDALAVYKADARASHATITTAARKAETKRKG